MTYSTFEDLPVWQEARQFVGDIYRLINSNNKLSRDFAVCDQLKRASYSIMLNISEGFERSSNKEFANFLNIAKESAGEVRSILYLIKDLKYTEASLNDLMNQVKNISTHISGFRKFLLSNKYQKR